jgi:outer membrane biosynthesis protein TonB
MAGLSALYYSKFATKNTLTVPNEQTIVTEKPDTDLKSEDFLPDSSVAALPVEKNIVPVESSEEIKSTEIAVFNKPQKNIKIESSTTKEKTKTTPITENNTTKSIVDKPSEKKSTATKTEEVKTPNGWSTLNGNVLAGRDRTLGEDRAYALRDVLIENGISENQITISSAVSGENPNRIVYRIVN